MNQPRASSDGAHGTYHPPRASQVDTSMFAPPEAEPHTIAWHRARLTEARLVNEHLAAAVLAARDRQADAERTSERYVKHLALVAHELRNPLATIRASTELQHRAGSDETVMQRLQHIIRQQIDHAARLVEDLLDGARAGTGKFFLQRGRVDVSGVLVPLIDSRRSAMQTKALKLELELRLLPAMVEGDPLRLAQIFSNLLDNAIKYTPPGGTIAVTLALAPTGGTLILTVADDGIGITPQALPRIFDLFVQEAHATAHAQQGLGIGLAIARELVEAHGGSIVASSRGRGLGSCFVVTLPTLVAATDGAAP